MTVDLTTELQRAAWAATIGSNLAQSISHWVTQQPWKISAGIAENRLSYQVNLEVIQKPPIERWAYMFADGVHNLRAALDNAVARIAMQAGVTDQRLLRQLSFPIVGNPDDWDIRPIKHLPAAYQEKIRSLQPFSPPPNGHVPLTALRDLDNQDKHRVQATAQLLPAALQHDSSVEFETEEGARLSVPPDITLNVVSLCDGGTLLVHRAKGRIARVAGRFDIHAQVSIQLPNGAWEGITHVLAMLCDHTTQVLNALSADLRVER